MTSHHNTPVQCDAPVFSVSRADRSRATLEIHRFILVNRRKSSSYTVFGKDRRHAKTEVQKSAGEKLINSFIWRRLKVNEQQRLNVVKLTVYLHLHYG